MAHARARGTETLAREAGPSCKEAFMRRFALVLAALAAALPASAQQAPGTSGADVGFFRPQANGDLSLTHTLPPEAYQSIPAPPAPTAPAAPIAPRPPTAPQAPAAATPATGAAPLVVVVPDTTRGTEDQMDRSREDAALANAAAARQPQRINGAFTGLTDERDR
jgi:hypothetical protein